MASSSISELVADRARFSQLLFVIGMVGIAAALVAGVVGWILASRATEALADTIEPLAGVAADVATTIEASQVMVSRTVDAIASIEDATTSTARALESVSEIVDQAGALAGGSVADSLDAAIDTLPGLIDTARIIDRTMRALSFVGVNYDPDVPLDQALGELESSLAPIPDQLRDQVELLAGVGTDLGQIAADANQLATVLDETRAEMTEAESTLASASQHANQAAAQVAAISDDIDTYRTLARVAVVAVTLALAAAASAPLLIGLRYRGEEDAV